MLTRKTFLKSSAAIALGGMFMPNRAASFFSGTAAKPIGLQLFTLFNVMDNDVPGTLKKISEIGYKEIESAFSRKGGYYGMKPKEFAQLAKDNGLSWQSHHVIGAPFKRPANAQSDTSRRAASFPPMKNLKENYQQLVDEAAEAGLPYLVCAGIPLTSTEEIKDGVEVLSKTGEACKKANITFAYHNHTHEFENVQGQVPYDVLLSQISADILKMELDLAWSTKANVDVVELFKKHPGRFPLFHVKDLDKNSGNPVEVGKGYVDFKKIFQSAELAGAKHFFVEQDGAPQPFENIATSFQNLQKILV